MTDRIRVLLVDDDALVRSGLRLMLAGDPDLEVVGELDDGGPLVATIAQLRPDVVLLDVRMPGTDGLTALRALRAGEAEHEPAVLILTTLATDAVLLDALRSGAAGFLLKHTPPAEIVNAVRAAAAGDPTVSPDALRRLIQHVAPAGETRDRSGAERFAALSDREREVAAAVAEGLGNAEIGKRLHLSQGTVKTHLSSALAKLGLDNRTQLAIAAHEAQQAE